MEASMTKKQAIDAFRDHVSYGKVTFFEKYGMNFVMGRREGPYLWNLDETNRLFNLHCNGGVFNLGHRNQELVDLLKESLDDLDIGNHHLMSKPRADLAQLLAELMPEDLDYTVFGVGGGEAVDLAFKVSRAYTGRSKIISALGGYHGHTGLALAAGDDKYRAPFGPQAPGFVQVPFGNLDALAAAADKDTAAVILETVPATLGVVIPQEDYLPSVRDLCNEQDILLILDEVQAGLGRSGKLWAFEHFGIVPDTHPLLERIVSETEKVWHFNHSRRPSIELALDGQISNWVWLERETGPQMIYVDTSTPLHRIEGQEQLDPELFLESAPSFLRWIIRWLFLSDVMNRYYNPRSVYIDLTANLYKEQRPDLVPETIQIINRYITDDLRPLSVKEVKNYYKEDKIIWTVFLAFRRLDCWIRTKFLRRRYEFILPGKIRR